MAKATPPPFEGRVIEVKYGHHEVSDVGFDGATFSVQSVRRTLRAGICISCDPRMNPEVHPEIQRLRTALLNHTAVEVRDLPGEWLVTECRVERHDLDFTVRVYFDLVEVQMYRPRFEPPLPPPEPMELPEKIAARKLAKRILGYDPDAPPVPPWSTFEAGLSFNELRVSFEKLSKALTGAGISTASAAASAAKLQAHIEQEVLMNSFQVELDADWPVKGRPKKKDGG